MAGWCVRHRRLVVIAWLLALIVVIGLARAAGSDFSHTLALPGTDSAKALSLLQSAAPANSGDTEQVVFATPGGQRLTGPAVRARAEALLAALARVPEVTRVASPYAPGNAGQLSTDRRTGYATVTFSQPAWDVSGQAGSQLLAAVRSADGYGLTAGVDGQVAENDGFRGGGLGGSTGIALAAAAVVLALVFGSLFATLLPLASAAVSLGTAYGLIELLSHVMSIPQFATELMPLIGLGVGIDYALFIVTRHRQGLRAGSDAEASIAAALHTSGRAVLVAGIIVCIAVLGMFALGVQFFSGLAVAAAAGVGLTMAAALTLLPALLGFLGPRVLSRRQRRRLRAGSSVRGEGETSARSGEPEGNRRGPALWERWAGVVSRHPALTAAAGLAVAAVAAVPFFALRLGVADAGTDPAGSTTRQAYDLLARGFGPGFNGPLQLAGIVRDQAQRAALARLVTGVRAQPDVARVLPPDLIPARGGGLAALVTVYPGSSPQAAATTALLGRLRTAVIPHAEAASGLHVYVGGTTAIWSDFSQVLDAKLALFVTVIVALSFAVLTAIFRSLAIPLVAAAMNLLSIGAALGLLVAAFQWNWAGPLLGIGQPGPVEPYLPVLIFAILFGLSMDYQVFLLSRVHEEWRRTSSTRAAVRHGLAATGRTITSAALIMIVVFAAFIPGSLRVVEELGLGLAGGVLIDAVIIRTAIVPSLMVMFGDATWRLPRWLDRALPRLHVQSTPEDQAAGTADRGQHPHDAPTRRT